MELADILKKLLKREDLTTDEASHFMTEIMTGQAGEVRTAAFLTALAAKGETSVEIEAFSRAMRKAALPWPGTEGNFVDTCGTGGDGAGTLNISTLSAVLLAHMGLKVAKHGNRAVSGTTGSADVLEKLGVEVDMPAEKAVQCLEKVGVCFLFAPGWHPAMKHAGPVRRALGFRTVFNLLGPLTNPAPVRYQVIGVFDPRLMDTVGHALAGLGRLGAYVVHSDDGLDEVSPAAPTQVLKIAGGKVERGVLAPEDFGFDRSELAGLRVRDKEDAVLRARAVLEGGGSDAEVNTVAMNAALVYSLAAGVPDLKEAAGRCKEALRGGGAVGVIEKWARFGNDAGTVVSLGGV
ncbi:MAG: anthranilate phosphoribosyltransferase [Spirochaetia bacterium]|nr:anthranilate phosphoribosyltransferase [Spirochaetia bacterium]